MTKGIILAGRTGRTIDGDILDGQSYFQNIATYSNKLNKIFSPTFNYRSAGAHRIAYHLSENGYDVEIIDFVESFDIADLQRLIFSRIRDDISWVGVSVTLLRSFDQQISKLFYTIKKQFPDVLLIVGGQNFGMTFDLNADVYVEGFSENVVIDILDSHYKNKEFPKHEIFFNNAKYVDGNHTNPSWPLPHYSLKTQQDDFLTSSDILSLELERGCRFKCNFCDFPILGVKHDYSVDEDTIYNQLIYNYENYGIKHYYISDETINSRNSKLEKLANAVNRCSFNPMFTGFIRLDLFHNNRDMLDLVFESNIVGHHYGIETFNKTAGKIIGKGFDPDRNKEMLLNIRDHYNKNNKPFCGNISMICGLPEQSLDCVQSDIDWYNNNYAENTMVFFPLSILKPNKSSGRNLSAFGLDLKKYGYREMNEGKFLDKIKQGMSQYMECDETQLKVLVDDYVIWENDNMDIVDSIITVHDFNLNNKIKASNWMFITGLAAGINDINQFSFNEESEIWDEYIEKSDQHIRDYIDNKMLTVYM